MIIWQVLKLVHGQIWEAAAHCVIACWFKMMALSGGAVGVLSDDTIYAFTKVSPTDGRVENHRT